MYKINGYNPETGEWNDSAAGDYLWSSVNTREASPDVMTPYSWSALRNGFSQMMMLPGYLPVGNICGRIYNNGSAAATAFKFLGQKNSFDASSKELYGIDPNDIDDWNVPYIPTKFRDRALVVRNAIQIISNVNKGLKDIESFSISNPAWCDTQHAIVEKMDEGELIRWSDEVLLPYMMRCFWVMVSPAITLSNAISKLRADLSKIVSPDDTVALLSNVSTEDEVLASLGIVAGLDRLRRGQMSREAYIKAYGHRGPHEAEISIPRPAEDPNWIEKQLDNLEYAPLNVETLLQEQRLRYENALSNLGKSTPKTFESLQKRLKEAARLTRLRETGRSEGIRAFWVSRSFVLRAGKLLGLNEDAFFLEHDEVINLLAIRNEIVDKVPARKAAYDKFNSLPQYPTIIMGRFDPVEWAADPDRRTDIFDATGILKPHITKQIAGLPGSAGLAEGRVRIIRSPEEGEQLHPGEILVAITTNVGWTPIFPRAAAVITDVGAPLSHAAIVARELGIPAVVGCFNATSILKDGDLVRVDGGQGAVEILNRATS